MPDRGSKRLLLVAVGALLVALPLVALVVFRSIPEVDPLLRSPLFHLAIVSAIAACALQVACVAAVSVSRAPDARVVLLAVGCQFVGLFMLGHGLTTPGVAAAGPLSSLYGGVVGDGGHGPNLWVGRFPVLAMTAFALALALAGWPRDTALHRAVGRHARAVLLWPVAATAVVGTLVVLDPESGIASAAWPGEHTLRHVVEYGAVGLLVATGLLHWRRYRLGGDRMQLALLCACWLSAQALASFEIGEQWRVSWWNYHVYLLTGFGFAVYAVLRNLQRAGSIDGVLGTVFATETLTHIESGYPEAMRALVAAVEARDSYTAGHSARVAALAVEIGERLKLPPEQLRSLAQGALLHDIGKIGIPDHILNKPGRLDAEERAWIEQHPIIGGDIVRSAPSLRHAIDVVHHHHERIDGAGYPDGLAGGTIPVAARIVAVADVWDALTTDRAYRRGWATTDALAHVEAGRGTHLDAACVDALVAILAGRGITATGAGDADVLAEAAEACHTAEEPVA